MKTVKNILKCLLAAFVLVAFPLKARSAEPDLTALKAALDASVKMEGKKVNGDLALTDQDGVRFKLGDYFKDGKPLVVSFIYTGCPDVCPTITAEFKRAVSDAEARLGSKFNVLSIGFDPANDTPAKLRDYGAKFTKDFSGFRFAAADPDTMKEIVKEFGFYSVRRDDGGFDHIDMVSVLRPDGTIYKQVYGVRSQADALIERLDELVSGRPQGAGTTSILTKIKYLCYRYDPYTGRYVIDYSIIAGFLIQSVIIFTIIFLVWGRNIKGLFKRLY